jgi:hypothetical protein
VLEVLEIKVLEVSVFDSKIKGCKSAKVRVADVDKEKAKNEANWP